MERMVCYGLGDEANLFNLLDTCIKKNRILVYLLPNQRNYPPLVEEAIRKGKEHFRVYEIPNGRMNVLRKRAERYVEVKPNSKLVLL